MSWSPEDSAPDAPGCPRCGGTGYISRFRQTGNPMAADPCGCDEPDPDELREHRDELRRLAAEDGDAEA